MEVFSGNYDIVDFDIGQFWRAETPHSHIELIVGGFIWDYDNDSPEGIRRRILRVDPDGSLLLGAPML